MVGGIDRDLEIRELRALAAALEARLQCLSERISRNEPGAPPYLRAFVDRDRCVGCGICRDVCPAGAVTVLDVARADPLRCMGCGICVAQCPRGAMRLKPVESVWQVRAAAP